MLEQFYITKIKNEKLYKGDTMKKFVFIVKSTFESKSRVETFRSKNEAIYFHILDVPATPKKFTPKNFNICRIERDIAWASQYYANNFINKLLFGPIPFEKWGGQWSDRDGRNMTRLSDKVINECLGLGLKNSIKKETK